MSEQLGLREVVAMDVGGLIGGGIFAVFGVLRSIRVAAEIAGNAAFLAHLIGGGVAMALDYSYARITAHLDEKGGSFTFIEHYTGNENVAGLVGWTLIVGYVGTMAMYAFAFGSFAVELLEGLGRPIVGIGAVFVSFEGFQLLSYEYTDIEGGIEPMETGIYLSIVISTVIYGLVTITRRLMAMGLLPGNDPATGET